MHFIVGKNPESQGGSITCPRVQCRIKTQCTYGMEHREEGDLYSIHVLFLPMRTSSLDWHNLLSGHPGSVPAVLLLRAIGTVHTAMAACSFVTCGLDHLCHLNGFKEGNFDDTVIFVTCTIWKSSTKWRYYNFLPGVSGYTQISTAFGQKCFFNWCLWNLTGTMIHSVNINR